MIFGSPLLTRLVSLFKKMPGIGEKSAQRMALYVLRSERETIEELARVLVDVKERVGLCEVCGNVSEEASCVICSDPRRTDEILCISQSIMVIEVGLPPEGGGQGSLLGSSKVPMK